MSSTRRPYEATILAATGDFDRASVEWYAARSHYGRDSPAARAAEERVIAADTWVRWLLALEKKFATDQKSRKDAVPERAWRLCECGCGKPVPVDEVSGPSAGRPRRYVNGAHRQHAYRNRRGGLRESA
jgi:hypothetical protein